jgi:protease PrsW
MDIAAVLQVLTVVLLAFIPAVIWLWIWRRRSHGIKAQKYVLLAFILGSFSVLPVLLIGYLWTVYPQTDIVYLIAQTKLPERERLLILFVVVAIFEEIAKFLVVLFVDKTKNLVHSIHDAIRFSVVAALGFAFAENILYFYNVGLSMNLYGFIALFAFRSIVTVCGHLMFSGIFGNYYGISKFSKSFSMHEYWGNTKKLDKRTLTDEMLSKRAVRFRILTIAKGLIIAVVIHASFNFLLETGETNNALWLIAIGFVYLIYLSKRSSGYLELVYTRSKNAHMKDKDKDVVLELLGGWYKEGKYLQVIDVSKRLLQKDPGNPVIRLFLNKAVDSQRFIDAYEAIRNLFVRKNYLDGLDDEIAEQSQKNN